MNVGRAALDGVVGAVAVTGVQWFDGHFGLGPLALASSDATSTVLVAMAVHLLLGAVFGIIYAWAFVRMRRAGWGIGLVLGAIHGALALALLAWLPLASLFPWLAPEPLGFGWFVGLHLLYGGIVGALGRLAVDPRARQVIEGTRREARAGS